MISKVGFKNFSAETLWPMCVPKEWGICKQGFEVVADLWKMCEYSVSNL